MQLSVEMNLSGLLPDIRPGRERFQVAIAPGSTHQPDTSNLESNRRQREVQQQ